MKKTIYHIILKNSNYIINWDFSIVIQSILHKNIFYYLKLFYFLNMKFK